MQKLESCSESNPGGLKLPRNRLKFSRHGFIMCMPDFHICFVTLALYDFREVYHFLGAPRGLLGTS